MDSSFPGGGPAVSYTNALPPGSGQQSSCVPGVSETDPLYTLCPALQGQRQPQPETGSLPQGADDPSKQYRRCASRGPMTYYQPYQPRGQNLWQSPALNTKDLGRVALQDSASGTDQINYNHSPVSPGTWPSPAQPFHPSIDPIQLRPQHNHQECVQTCTPTSVDDYQMSDCELGRSYTSGVTGVYDTAPANLRPHQPSPVSLSSGYSPAPRPSVDGSPDQALAITSAPMATLKVEASPSPAFPEVRSRESSEAPKKGALKGVAKKDEPYAKLIERALRSRPDYSMQLQEIYQWFTENTDKARSFQAHPKEGKGWQNSIRHNLSMNAAFTKRDEDRTGNGSSSVADHKRSTVWVLAPWAVREGVQSTTRYRKVNSSRRAGAARAISQPFNLHLRPSSTRNLSGLTIDSAARIPRLPSQPYSSGVGPVQSHHVFPPGTYGMRSSAKMPYHAEPQGLPRIDTVTQDPFKQEGGDGGVPLSQTPRPNQPHHQQQNFGMPLPNPMMVDGMASRASPSGPYSMPQGLPGSVSFGLPQTTFPYGVQDVHVGYPCGQSAVTPGSGTMFDQQAQGYCGFNDDEI